jgi:hypothetical protein
MVTTPDTEFEPWPPEVEPEDAAIREAISAAIGAALAFTDDEAKRKVAIGELIEVHRHVMEVLATGRPQRLN